MNDQPQIIYAVTEYNGREAILGQWFSTPIASDHPCAEYVLKSATDARLAAAEAMADALRFADETFRDLGWHAKWEVTTAAIEKWEAGK